MGTCVKCIENMVFKVQKLKEVLDKDLLGSDATILPETGFTTGAAPSPTSGSGW